jgi:hypothetical protein
MTRALPSADGRVSFERALDRRLVHRQALAEVFVTSVVPAGPRRWVCGVQLSRSHRRMPDPGGLLPASLVLEASRQAGLAIAHLGLNVGWEQQFLLDEVAMRWLGERPRISGDRPMEATLDVRVDEVMFRSGVVGGLAFGGTWSVDGQLVVEARARMRCVSPGNFRALRRIRPPRGAGAAGSGDLVTWDEADPMLFDHRLDHVPGMALIDAAVTAARDHFRGLVACFHRFAELDAPVLVERAGRPGRRPGEERMTFSFSQLGALVATCEVESIP